MSLEISVITPHLNQPEDLKRCLASLLMQKGAPEFEIIVVDNGSTELPKDACSVDPRIRLIEQPVPGPGPARNKGVGEARAPILAFIDADCIPDSGWMSEIVAHFAAHPEDGVLGGDVRIDRVQKHGRASAIEAYESIFSYRMREYIVRQGFTGTGNLAVRAKVMAEVGAFGGIDIAEDRDWGHRASSKGYDPTYVEGMIVYHPARKTFRELRDKWARQVAHDCKLYQEKPHWQMRWLMRAVVIAASPVVEIPYIARSPKVSGFCERLLAFTGVIQIRAWRALLMLGFLFRDPEKVPRAWNRG